MGVPPSGPMDALAFRLANALVGNEESAAGLEITLSGVRSSTTSQFPITFCHISAGSLKTICPLEGAQSSPDLLIGSLCDRRACLLMQKAVP